VTGAPGLPFKDDELESRLVWIFGSPRTGSTWLLELLAHPLRLEARDPLGFRAPADLATPVDVLPINESLLPTHLAPPGTEGTYVRDRPWIRVPSDIFGEMGAYFLSTHFEEVWRAGIRELARSRFGAHVERAAGSFPVDERAFVVIKEPNGSHAAPLTMSLLPEARLIFLYRDGRDVVDSLLAMNAAGGLLAEWSGMELDSPEQRLALVRAESLNWVVRMAATEQAFRERPPELRHRVRYEDLVSDPARCVDQLVGWLELERDAAAIEGAIEAHAFGGGGQSLSGSAATRRAGTPGLWRDNLNPEEAALAHEIMGETLGELGYEVPD
jgi:Sulfotransferase family